MPRRDRPAETTRSEHWLREAVNRFPAYLNQRVTAALDLPDSDGILWLSPMKGDEYAEYFDQAFLNLLGLDRLRGPLKDFWPEVRVGMAWLGRSPEKSSWLKLRHILKRPSTTRAKPLSALWNRSGNHLRKRSERLTAPRTRPGSRRSINMLIGSHISTSCKCKIMSMPTCCFSTSRMRRMSQSPAPLNIGRAPSA
jgi:hypothetical protein